MNKPSTVRLLTVIALALSIGTAASQSRYQSDWSINMDAPYPAPLVYGAPPAIHTPPPVFLLHKSPVLQYDSPYRDHHGDPYAVEKPRSRKAKPRREYPDD